MELFELRTEFHPADNEEIRIAAETLVGGVISDALMHVAIAPSIYPSTFLKERDGALQMPEEGETGEQCRNTQSRP
ncbi:UNVERIFIED_CONTAM: hypothetical protein Sradi_6221900 [Sesamum radiatum]|uniref:Uncharacterized protein n=1 Tax=Sesamum radiatum TaxID=300843 RepID=A0AAW2KAZ7_SESRA